jgi:plasmid replication initiation protein
MSDKVLKNSLVVSSNDLIHAKYDLNLWQKRLFVYAISQIQKDDKDFAPIRMYIVDILNFYQASDGTKNYKAIIDAPAKLDRTIEIPYLSELGHTRYAYVKLIQKVTIPTSENTENQYIEITFNNELKPHLLDLKAKFLKYDITNIIKLQSVYSFRMFELLKSYEYRTEIEFKLDYLRMIFEVENSYKAYRDFKKFIILKSQEDLLKYCDITFTFTEKKTKNKVTSLLFLIAKNKKETVVEIVKSPKSANIKNKIKAVEEPKPKYIHNVGIDANATKEPIAPEPSKSPDPTEALYTEFEADVVKGFGVTPFVLVQLLQNYDAELIRKQIRITKRKRGTGEAINIAGFFVNAVKSDYNDPEEAKEEKKREKERQKALKKQALREELQELIDLVIQQENNTARKLLANDEGLRMRAIEYATKVITNSPSLQKIVEEKEYDLATLDLLFWKQDKFLHAYFIEAIKKLEPKSFGYLKSLVERVEELDVEIKSLA